MVCFSKIRVLIGYDCKCFLHYLANGNEEVVLQGKARFGSVPSERVQIVGSPAEFLMQIGQASRVASLYSKDIVSPVLVSDGAASPSLEIRFT